ncbi:MAG: hypothetical protein ABH883_05920, partial [Candidatus Omnitrophota bacterium]
MSFLNKRYLSTKAISIILITVFLNQQAGWAQTGEYAWAQEKGYSPVSADPGRVHIPYGIGSAREAVSAENADMIIHIQDAHASLSAQYSIAALLDSLVTDYNLSVVALEGASGYVDTSLLKTFPDKDIRKDTAEFLMREGRMSAGEFFAITRDDSEICLYGVEDDELYRANARSFKDAVKRQDLFAGEIASFKKELGALEEVVFSDQIRDFTRKSAGHKRGEISFTAYWEQARRFCEKYGLTLTGYTELTKLVRSVELEKEIDFNLANRERAGLIDALSAMMEKKELEALVLKSLEFKENRISQEEFHDFLLKIASLKGVKPDEYINLRKFTVYIKLYASVELISLYGEIEKLEESLRESMYRNNDERELYAMSGFLTLVEKLFRLELTSEEYASFLSRYKEFTPEKAAGLIKNMCSKYKIPVSGGYSLRGIFGSGMEEALDFYRKAEARNSAMIENTVKRMKAEGKHAAALITGGFHTEGLTALMKEKKLSYLVVIPKFESGKDRPYVAVLTNKKKEYEK